MSELRKFLLNTLVFEKILPNIPKVFEDASVDSMIFIGRHNGETQFENSIEIIEMNQSVVIPKHLIKQERFFNNDNYVFTVEANDQLASILEKMRDASQPLSDFFEITRGINPYDSYRGQSKEIIENKVYHADFKKDETFIPEIRGRHMDRYFYEWDGKSYVSYGPWLAAPREEKFFKNERIIFRQVLGERLICTIIEEDLIIDQSVFIALPIAQDLINTRFVLSLLASRLGATYFKFSSNEFDDLFPKIKLGEFKNLPIKLIPSLEQKPFINMVETILDKKKQLHTLTTRFLTLLTSKTPGLNPTKKLKSWPDLSFAEFLKELKKQKIAWSLKEEAEWLEYFTQEQAAAQVLQQQIDATDREIDRLVYALYELTEEEIALVEG